MSHVPTPVRDMSRLLVCHMSHLRVCHMFTASLSLLANVSHVPLASVSHVMPLAVVSHVVPLASSRSASQSFIQSVSPCVKCLDYEFTYPVC